jgi:hypothetical protein
VFVGNPIDLSAPARRRHRQSAPAPAPPKVAVALAAPADLPEPATVLPPLPGSFSFAVAPTTVRATQRPREPLREQKLSPYTIDILMAPDDLQRRLLLGDVLRRATKRKP